MNNKAPLVTPNSLQVGMIGNCAYSALIDQQSRIVWCCLPRFDGDPVFMAQHGFGLNYEAERWKAIRFAAIKDYQVREAA